MPDPPGRFDLASRSGVGPGLVPVGEPRHDVSSLIHVRQVPPDVHKICILRKQVDHHRQRIAEDPFRSILPGSQQKSKMFLRRIKLRVHICPVPPVVSEPDCVKTVQVESGAGIAVVLGAGSRARRECRLPGTERRSNGFLQNTRRLCAPALRKRRA